MRVLQVEKDFTLYGVNDQYDENCEKCKKYDQHRAYNSVRNRIVNKPEKVSPCNEHIKESLYAKFKNGDILFIKESDVKVGINRITINENIKIVALRDTNKEMNSATILTIEINNYAIECGTTLTKLSRTKKIKDSKEQEQAAEEYLHTRRIAQNLPQRKNSIVKRTLFCCSLLILSTISIGFLIYGAVTSNKICMSVFFLGIIMMTMTCLLSNFSSCFNNPEITSLDNVQTIGTSSNLVSN